MLRILAALGTISLSVFFGIDQVIECDVSFPVAV